MNIKEYLLICLSEEINEVVTAIIEEESQNELELELIDMITVMKLLREESINLFATEDKEFEYPEDYTPVNDLLSLQKIICKGLRFSLDDYPPTSKISNIESFREIFNKIINFYNKTKFWKIDDNKAASAKKKKLKRYIEYSKTQGVIN